MKRPGLPREKVLATVVHLLETTLIRVGNDDYARANKSYGLTTLRDPHVEDRRARICASASRARAARPGTSRSRTGASPASSRPARTCRARSCSSTSTRRASSATSTSADVNAYLREITGEDITAKDFRTWAGTVAGRPGAPGIRGLRQRGQGQEAMSARRSRGWRAGSAIRPPSAASATSTPRSSTVTSRAT